MGGGPGLEDLGGIFNYSNPSRIRIGKEYNLRDLCDKNTNFGDSRSEAKGGGSKIRKGWKKKKKRDLRARGAFVEKNLKRQRRQNEKDFGVLW